MATAPISTSKFGDRNLWIAIGVSLAAHAVALSLHFRFPDASRAFRDKALDIILVNSKSARSPRDAQALAQANLDAGGNTDKNLRTKTPLPPSLKQRRGDELEQANKRVQALETQQQRLLTLAHGKPFVPDRSGREAQSDPSPLRGRDLASRALAMARFEGEIDRETEEYNKRPRKRFIGTRTTEYRFAQYIENWRLKVERVGTLNYPEAARSKLYGNLILTVSIKSDGSVASVDINRPSGHKILDAAARRIVSMAAPYASFPPDIRRDTDILVITRSWSFTSGDRLETK